MSTKPFPMPGQLWMFAGSDLAPSSGPHTIKNLRWFHGAAEAVFDDGSVASIRWMMELDAWQHVDARPDDLAELARLTAVELRRRGIWASTYKRHTLIELERAGYSRFVYSLHHSDFDNLDPRGCADMIQAEEAKRATEWAGDK